MTFTHLLSQNGVGYNKLAPFQHPSIIATLQDVIFKGSRGSALSEKHTSRFPMLPATGLQPKRRMISEAMVCMAATAVRLSYAVLYYPLIFLIIIGSCCPG